MKTTSYEILVRGRLGERFASEIGARCFEVTPERTLIVVDIIDQSHLRGVLTWLQDRNFEIERMNAV